jgi:C4-type Zn-finger protein
MAHAYRDRDIKEGGWGDPRKIGRKIIKYKSLHRRVVNRRIITITW